MEEDRVPPAAVGIEDEEDENKTMEDINSLSFQLFTTPMDIINHITPYYTSNTRPNPQMMNILFLSILSQQLIPPYLHSKLLNESTFDKKWDIICAYYNLHTPSSSTSITSSSSSSSNSNSTSLYPSSMNSSTTLTTPPLTTPTTPMNNNPNPNNSLPINPINFTSNDLNLLQNLQKNKFDILLILQLKTRLCTGNKEWICEFMNCHGMEIILNLIEICLNSYPFGEYHAAILYELLSSLKFILNNGISMRKFLEISSSIRLLTSSLIFEWKLISLQILEILCVLCDYSSDIALNIAQHLKYLSYSQHKLPYEYLIQHLIDCDLDVKASIIQLLNHMICSISDIHYRIQIRNQIQSLQFYIICDLILKDLNFEYQQIKSLKSHKIRKSLHHMSSTSGITTNILSSPSSSSSSSTSTGGGGGVLRIKKFFEINKSAPVMKWIRRKRIKAQHLLTSKSLLQDPSSPLSESPMYLQTLSLSATSNQSAEPIYYSHYSEDGTTPIRPYLGIMCGTLHMIKNNFSFSDLYHMGTALKQRYFELLENNFSWWNMKSMDGDPMGTIHTSQIKSIRIHSYNEEINQVCPYTFEIVFLSGHVYSYGCKDVLTYNNWLLALNYVFNHNLLIKSSYVLIPQELNTEDFKIAKNKFQKQLTVYQVLDHEDYQRYQLTFGPSGLILPTTSKKTISSNTESMEMKEGENSEGINPPSPSPSPSPPPSSTPPPVTLQLTNYLELMQYLYHNMLTYHLDSKLYTLLQELILVPLGRPYGDIFWNILLSYCQCMRSARHILPEMATSLTPSLSHNDLMSEINKYVMNNLTLEECFQEIVNIESTVEGKQSHELRQMVKSLFSKDAEILRLQDELQTLKASSDFKARSASNVSDFSFSPEHTETDDDNQKEITQKSVTQLIDAYNAATNTTSSSPISPKSSPSGKSKHRTNPSRDIRFTYLREVEGKGDDGGLHHVEKNDGSKKHERHVSFPQFSNDELDSNLSPRGRKDSTFVDLNAQIRSLQHELQQSQYENEKLQQEIRLNKTMSVRANNVVKELFTKNAEVLRLKNEVKYLQRYIEENSLPLPTIPFEFQEASVLPDDPVVDHSTNSIPKSLSESTEGTKKILRLDSAPEISLTSLESETPKRRDSDASDTRVKSLKSTKVLSMNLTTNPLFRKMIHLEHPKTTSSIESEEVVSETKSSHEGVASEGSTRVENEPPVKEKEGVLQSTPPHGIKVGKLKQTTKDSPLAALFARQPPPEMKSESVNPPLSLNQPTRGDGKIKNDSLAQLIAGRPTLNVGVPKPITTTTSLPLAVPNSSRKIPIPPFPPGYSPPSSSSSQNQLKPAVSSTRIIPPPPTPPFNPADYMSKKLSPSIPALPVITKKKSPEYVSKHKPKCKMKGIFWNKLSSQQCSKSLFWSSITIKHLDNLDIDYGLLEESFCDTSMKTPSSTSGTPNSQISEKPKIITLFDSRRTQNILISLNKLKLTAEECVNLLVELNPQVLTLERCDLLMNLTPSSDEFKQLLSYSRTNNMTLLGKSEQFLYSLTRIYHLKERLECHKLLFTWNTAIDNLTGDINIINTACYELLHGNNTSNECKNKLLIIFSMILAVGNYMNSSSGGTTSTSKHSTTGSRIATGITLESILKLGTIKVSKEYKNIKKNYTLLHYIIYQLQVKYPESLTFYQNWKCVLTAGEISFTQIINEIIRLKKELNQIQEELNHLMMKKQQCYLALETTSTSTSSSITTSTSSLTGTSSPEEIHFLIRLIECAEERFQPFLLQGNNLLKHLQTNFLSVEKILQSTMEVFGENYTPLGGLLGHGNSSTSTEGGTNMSNKDLNDDKCQQFFKILSQIMILFQKIEQEIQSNELMRQKMMNKVSPSNEIQKGGRRISLEPQRNVVQENLFDNFRSNEDESPEKIVELFRSKFPLRR